MKKIVGILAAAAVATSAFAVDFSAGVNSKMGFTSSGYGWMEDQIGTDNLLSVSASTDVAGANFDIRAKEAAKAADSYDARGLFLDGYNVWVKPVQALKLTMGTGADFSIFGDGYGKGDGKIGIINDGTGIKAELTPVEGLWIGARYGAPANKYMADVEGQMKWEVGASYTIDGIGVIGGEFAREGQNNGAAGAPVDYLWNAAMAGFKLTAVENLTVIVDWAGWFFNRPAGVAVNGTTLGTKDSMQKIGAFVKFNMDALELYASDRVILRSYGNKMDNYGDYFSDFANIVCAGASYTVGAFKPYVNFGWTLNNTKGDNEFKGKVDAYDNPTKGMNEALTIGCDYNVGAATVNVEFTINECDTDMKANNVSSTTWELPIKFKYAF